MSAGDIVGLAVLALVAYVLYHVYKAGGVTQYAAQVGAQIGASPTFNAFLFGSDGSASG